MSPSLDLPKTLRLIAVSLALAAAFPATEALAVQLETPEIVFTGSDAKPLADMAAQLGNAVAIYEYAHNYFEISTYHGSRSGSINTFMGQHGSDVDIATAMIAMMRSQNIPARYAVGTIRLPAAQLTNWLKIGNLDVAVQVLKDQGIQGVVLAADRSTVDFEHVWAEVLVPFAQYRGLTTGGSVDCSLSANASLCNWIPLDGSFKQKTYNGLNIDPYNALSFDYTGYYRAIVDSATDPLKRQDKNPLPILEEQIAAWLRTSNPGKTLEDVADAGQINQIHDGLLPASLPYTVTGTIRHYDSVALHDAAVPTSEPKKWGKTLSISIHLQATLTGGGSLTIDLGAGNALLAQLNTQRLTLSTEFPAPGNIPNMVTRLGGVEIARPLSGNGTIVGYTPGIGNPYTITVTMDGTPDASGGSNDKTITATYSAIIGGYYLIATGGETSNWSQVHRAADQLLTNNVKDTIVFNPADNNVINPATGQACDLSTGLNCIPYVDINGTGVYAANDPALLQDKPVLDDLTGGLLYVAASQYFANMRDQFDRADHLMKAKTPIVGFLGVVSSTYEAEYIGSTAFSILPGGLLIDMKGITIGGSYRTNDTPLTYSNRQFEFLGHITSSLEHETWQELTGYDAVSTVRGIQMALANGTTTLLDVKFDGISNTLPAFYNGVGFGATAPSPFSLVTRSLYATTPNSWSNPTFTALNGFEVIKKVPTGTTDSRLGTLSYYNDYWDSNLGCFDNNENALNNLKVTYGGAAGLTAGGACGATWVSGTSIDSAIVLLQNSYNSYRGGINAGFFNYLDAAQGFLNTNFVYRSKVLAANAYSTATVTGIRNDLLLRDTSLFRVEYVMPSTLVTGPNNHFEVDIRKVYSAPTGRLNSLSFEILNRGK